VATSGVGGTIRTTGPGRVNLIGDHTDYNLGLALPMAINLGVTLELVATDDDRITVISDAYPGERASFPIDPDVDVAATLDPPWARLLAAVAGLARPESGWAVHVASTLPRGAGLSSSAALAVALADAFSVDGEAVVVARLCREAEHRTGVPVGLMDPLVCAGGRAGHALRIDCATESTRDVPLPAGAEIVVVDSGLRRDLRSSAYATRVAECEAAAAVVGPLGLAGPDDLPGLRDPILRRRTRHVISECARVDAVADAMGSGDLGAAGSAMDRSHRSLAEDFDVTTPELDGLVATLRSRPGVFGARMTGAGFGGCVVVLAEPGALDPHALGLPAWRVEPVDGSVTARIARTGPPTAAAGDHTMP
jgi:galactokinase